MALSMAQMGQDPALERFLGATVGEDSHGIDVTVLSMLARLNIDPWIEASELTAMPDGAAHKRLDSLMARFKDVPGLVKDRGRIISRLLDFLPRNGSAVKQSAQDDTAKQHPLSNGRLIFGIIAAILFLSWFASLAQGQ